MKDKTMHNAIVMIGKTIHNAIVMTDQNVCYWNLRTDKIYGTAVVIRK